MSNDTILLNVHPEITGLNTVDSGAELASKTHAVVKVMHVVEDYPQDMSEWWNVCYPKRLHNQIVRDRQAFLDSVVARVKEAGVERVESVLGWGREFLEITREVLRHHHKLVVTTFRRQGLRARMGCTCTTGLCRYTPCTVWMMQNRFKKPFKRLVVTLEGEGGEIRCEEGLNAKILKTAAAMAEHRNSELHVVHVLPRYGGKGLNGKLPHTDLAEYVDELRHEIEAGCNALFGDNGLSLTKNRLHLLVGSPAAVLPAFVQKKGIDLIVMGTHARMGLPGLLVGNTAEKVMAQLDCEVLVVKSDDFVSAVDREENATSGQWAVA
jgi:nucleotide-binding universal stress UspA family protein